MHLIKSYDNFLIVDFVDYSIDAIAIFTTVMVSITLKESYDIARAEHPQLRLNVIVLLICSIALGFLTSIVGAATFCAPC